jgi:hypothetical protein
MENKTHTLKNNQENEPTTEEQKLRPYFGGGMPKKFQTPEELETLINAYFADCDPHIEIMTVLVTDKKTKQQKRETREIITLQKPYTISGLARACGTTRRTLLDYEKLADDDFSPLIKEAKARCEEFAEHHLFTGNNATGVIFNLKNNYGWIDRSEQVNDLPEDLKDAIQKAQKALPD